MYIYKYIHTYIYIYIYIYKERERKREERYVDSEIDRFRYNKLPSIKSTNETNFGLPKRYC